jgi:hypothetical protein
LCQGRTLKVMEDPEILTLILEMAERKKIGNNFSISSVILEEQRSIEHGGIAPGQRLRIMRQLER